MPRIYLPAIIGLIAILSISAYEGIVIKDRWVEPGQEAEEMSKRFNQVPLNLGDWKGEDMPVDEVTRKTAGAVGYVSRVYRNEVSGKAVRLWLIVGNSLHIVRHTPDVCYPSSGFRRTTSQTRCFLDTNEEQAPEFYTAKFEKEDATGHTKERVFWTFNHPEKNRWEAPVKGARWHYGNSKALYKLYFTSNVLSDEDTIEDNVANDFAKLMLPEIDKALFPKTSAAAAASAENSADEKGSETKS